MMSLVWDLLRHAVLGAVATLGFAVWFNLPRDALMRAGAIGAAGYVARFLLLNIGQPPYVASFWAAFVVGLSGFRFTSLRYPRVMFTVTGIIPLVPGIPAYQALVFLSKGNAQAGLESSLKATLIIASLSGGLTVARALTMLRRRQVMGRG